MDKCWSLEKDALYLQVKAVPGASKNELLEVCEGRLRIRIAATPQDNKANDALRAFSAKTFGCPKNAVSIVNGEKSRFKTLRLPRSVLEKVIPYTTPADIM